MKLTCLRFVALISAALLLAARGSAATTPRYGGVLRVELRATGLSLDPREWQVGSLESGMEEKLGALLFDRLVVLDDYGRFRRSLATEWSHDAASKRWQFTLRGGVQFSDGAALTAEEVATVLQPLLPATLQISAAGANVLVIQSATPAPDLLEQLASGRFFVYRTAANGTVVGTGPFILGRPTANGSTGEELSGSKSTADKDSSAPGAAHGATHFYFRANDEAWSGRPFVDGIDVTLGVPALRAMFDLELGKVDLIDLAPELVPRARQSNLRVWSSDPVVLYGLRFEDAQGAAADVALRQALALALDRGTMANVLLQKQAQPAAALLPEWLSGYAFLFNVETNLERAKELRRSLAANAASPASPLRLRVDPAGDLPKLLGERVAVNARQAAILVQVMNRTAQHGGTELLASPSTSDRTTGVHLFAWHYSSLSPRAELDAMFAAYHLADSAEMIAGSTDRGQLYTRERRVLEDWRVLPLVEEAESVGVGAAVRDWTPARWGEWRLADVWLENSEAAQAASAKDSVLTAGSSTQVGARTSGTRP